MSKLILKNKPVFISAITAFVCGLFLLAHNAHAQYRTGLEKLGGTLGLQKDPSRFVGDMIIAALGLVGVVTLALIIYAGFMWLISQGDTAKITKAKNIMIYAVIGLAIILLSYGIVHYVIFNGFFGTNSSGQPAVPTGNNALDG